jgi:hypothetical protein
MGYISFNDAPCRHNDGYSLLGESLDRRAGITIRHAEINNRCIKQHAFVDSSLGLGDGADQSDPRGARILKIGLDGQGDQRFIGGRFAARTNASC